MNKPEMEATEVKEKKTETTKCEETGKKLEEGEFEENWEAITPGKGSRSPILKYGEVKILTPSRFSALLEVDEKGESVNLVEYEEILSIEEEILVEETNEESSKEVSEEVSNEVNKEVAVQVENEEELDQDKSESEMKEAKDEKSNQAATSIAGIEHWPDLATNSIRPSLPRRSKTLHKVVPDKISQKGTPGKQGKVNNKISSQ